MKNFSYIFKLLSEDTFSKGKKKGIVPYILIGVLGLFLSFTFNIMFYMAYLETGYLNLYPSIVSLGVFSLIFFSTIYQTKSLLFSLKDEVNLTVLPINKKDIITAKLAIVYVEELLFSFIIYLPCIILYSIHSPIFILYGILMFLTIPLFSILLAFIVGILISLLVIRFNFLRYVGTALYVAFIILLCMFSAYMQNFNPETSDISMLINMQSNFPFNILNNIFIEHQIIPLIIYLLIAIIATIVVILVYSLLYDKMYQLLNYVAKKKDYKKEEIKAQGMLKSLINVNFKKLANEQMFLISALMPGIISMVIALVTYFSFRNVAIDMPEEIEVMTLLMKLSPLMMFFSLGMTPFTSISYTLEGKNFWINKTLPINPKSDFLAKIIINQIITGIFVLIGAIVLSVIVNYDIISIILFILGLELFVLAMGIIGLLFNLKYYKLSWSNFQQIKNSASPNLTSLVGIALSLVIITVGVLLMIFVDFIISFIVVSLISLVLVILGIILLNKIGTKLYYKMEF